MEITKRLRISLERPRSKRAFMLKVLLISMVALPGHASAQQQIQSVMFSQAQNSVNAYTAMACTAQTLPQQTFAISKIRDVATTYAKQGIRVVVPPCAAVVPQAQR